MAFGVAGSETRSVAPAAASTTASLSFTFVTTRHVSDWEKQVVILILTKENLVTLFPHHGNKSFTRVDDSNKSTKTFEFRLIHAIKKGDEDEPNFDIRKVAESFENMLSRYAHGTETV